jgi:voltage-gated potassium channel
MTYSKKTLLRALRFGLIASYFGTWFIFGILYQRAANNSHGDAFIFQQDLKLKSQAEAFRDLTGTKVSLEGIQPLIIHGDYEQFFTGIQAPSDNEVHLYVGAHLNSAWAEFYEKTLAAQGYTHFILSEDPEKPIGFGWRDTSHRTRLQLFSQPEHRHTLLSSSGTHWTTDRSYTLWLDTALHAHALDEVGVGPFLADDGKVMDILPLDGLLRTVLIHSRAYLDQSIYALRRVMVGAYKYPLLDFLYFSAVTVTTVGYGDILPNSSYVRILVMVEALLGVTLIGGFVSSLFLKAD